VTHDVPLEFEAFWHGLDDKFAICEVVQRCRVRDAGEHRGPFVLGQLPTADGPGGGTLDVLATALDGDVARVDSHDVVAGSGEHLGNTGSHGAEPDDAHLADLAVHATPCRRPEPAGTQLLGVSHQVAVHSEAPSAD
jgi:hypothetical protein